MSSSYCNGAVNDPSPFTITGWQRQRQSLHTLPVDFQKGGKVLSVYIAHWLRLISKTNPFIRAFYIYITFGYEQMFNKNSTLWPHRALRYWTRFVVDCPIPLLYTVHIHSIHITFTFCLWYLLNKALLIYFTFQWMKEWMFELVWRNLTLVKLRFCLRSTNF